MSTDQKSPKPSVTPCAGLKLSGRARGEQCSLIGLFEWRGKKYCGPHYAIASKAPHRFREALQTFGRRLVRQEAAKRYRDSQLDAFLIEPGMVVPPSTTIINESPTESAMMGIAADV